MVKACGRVWYNKAMGRKKTISSSEAARVLALLRKPAIGDDRVKESARHAALARWANIPLEERSRIMRERRRKGLRKNTT